MQKRLTQLENELAASHSPGTSSVTLQPTKASGNAWASAVWGELSGKEFVQVRAYELKSTPHDKTYKVWYQAGDTQPVLIGALDPGPNGAAFASASDLPMTDKGVRLFVTLGDENAKAPTGDALLETKLIAPAGAEKEGEQQ